jgi:hypothetical protein
VRLPCKRHAGRNICGWLGIVAGPAVFVAAQPVPLDDPALVVALGLAVRQCGELDAGVEGPVVWIACECGACMARRADDDADAAH